MSASGGFEPCVALGLDLVKYNSPGGPETGVHYGAYDAGRLVGFVKLAWDGGDHAFVLDTTVHPEYQRRGIGRLLVRRAAGVAEENGVEWLHVDYEPHLEGFYARCRFRPTPAGLIRLGDS